ncbi:hypothetical protein LSTR_LSTR009009 [Laodelphax striatellus]|uniref:C2HC/C3H-type domain-containing protein n=1 Tax=Laodelphax striatellus TaxID=195883 RepID=A0A482WYG3_LAOST|nr:hypothetical protein LSTR_LSTR009009 [Laodelphax striatellus]
MTDLKRGDPKIEDRTSPMAVVQRYPTNPSPKMSSDSNVSKLSLMQARFQQRQQQEKEQKLLQLYSEQAQQAYARIAVGGGGSGGGGGGGGAGGGGKVRQLFQERRGGGAKPGLDRSYPLQPLESRRATSLDRSHQQRNKKPASTLYKGTPQRYPSAGYEGDDDYFYQPQNNNILYTSQQRIDQNFIDYPQTKTKQRIPDQDFIDYPQTKSKQKISDQDFIDYPQTKSKQRIPDQDFIDFPQTKSKQKISDQDFIDYPQPKSNGFIKQKQQVFNDENDFLPRAYDLDATKIFKKLPNIGGALLTEQKAMMAPAKESELKKPTPLAVRARPDPAVKAVTKSMSKLSTTKKPEVKVSPSSNVVQSRLAAAAASPATNSSSESKQPSRLGVRRPTPVPSTNNSIGSRPSSGTNHAHQEPVRSRIEPKSTTPSKSTTARPPATKSVPAGLVGCDNCGRNFAPDRIDAHRNICLKTSKKKRKPFDPTKQRLKGTGAESYLKKGKTATPPQVTAKKSNWRKKHEEFINNIRAAKVAQAHVAAGGKISDLPPPPPSDTSDYVQCPHCSRKFNEGAASRHIPKCANMQHNKPKPVQQGQNRMQAARKKY